MINTVSIKSEQLTNGYFQDGSGEEKILLMGSCRVAPYLNYFHKWNEQNCNRFTIYSLDPFNFNWNVKDERTDFETALSKWETDERMLSMLKSVNIFIHEFYQNAGMFNTDRNKGKTIYDFGLSPSSNLIPVYDGSKRHREMRKMDICLPNFNDYFILFKDIVTFDLEIRKKVMQDINVTGKISGRTLNEMYLLSQKGIDKFYEVCRKSDIPEMEDFFEANFIQKRLFHTYNHVSKHFTLKMFSLINEKFLGLELDDGFWYSVQQDMFANNFTPLTKYDIEFYGYEWQSEEIKELL